MALQDGDQVAFKTHGSHFNAQYQYLNAGTVDGSVGMAKNTEYASASGTWWKAHKLSNGSWAFESLGSIPNAQHIYLNANTYTGTLDLVGSTDYATISGTHWSLQTLSDGNVIEAIIQAGCTHGLQNCDINKLNGVLSQLKGNTDATTIQQIEILIGSMIGSMAGVAACDGITACEWIGGKIGATLTCLSISKEVFGAMKTAVSTLQNVANQAGTMGQDAVNAITNASNDAENGVQDAINQLSKGGDAVRALKGVTNQVGQSFTDLGSPIVGGLSGVGGAIQGAGEQAGSAIVDTGKAIGDAFCGVFGC